MKYRILIIDDEFDLREDIYNKLFDEAKADFEIVGTTRLDEIKDESQKAHLAIVDTILDDEDLPLVINGTDIIDFLSTQNPSLPIYLISGKWSKIQIETYHKKLLQTKIVGGANFDLISESSQERGKVIFEIVNQINQNQNHVTLNLDKNDDFVVLHISDLQFGGKWEGAGDTNQEKYYNVMIDILKTFPKQQSGEKIKPNLLILSGDVAQTAHPAEYQLALKNLNFLCDELDISKNQRFVVPGNHDLSTSLLFSMSIDYDVDNEELSIKDKHDPIYGFFGLESFKKFSHLFTGRDDWKISLDSVELAEEGSHFISSMYNIYGISVLGVSTVSVPRKEQCTKPKLSISAVNKILPKLSTTNCKNEDLVNIIILHHSPWRDNDDSLGIDGISFLAGIENVNDSIIAFGHKHKSASNTRPLTETSLKHTVFSIAPTPSLIKREPDTLRGYNLIKLNRRNDKVTGCTIEHYEYTKHNYSLSDVRKYRRLPKKGWETLI